MLKKIIIIFIIVSLTFGSRDLCALAPTTNINQTASFFNRTAKFIKNFPYARILKGALVLSLSMAVPVVRAYNQYSVPQDQSLQQYSFQSANTLIEWDTALSLRNTICTIPTEVKPAVYVANKQLVITDAYPFNIGVVAEGRNIYILGEEHYLKEMKGFYHSLSYLAKEGNIVLFKEGESFGKELDGFNFGIDDSFLLAYGVLVKYSTNILDDYDNYVKGIIFQIRNNKEFKGYWNKVSPVTQKQKSLYNLINIMVEQEEKYELLVQEKFKFQTKEQRTLFEENKVLLELVRKTHVAMYDKLDFLGIPKEKGEFYLEFVYRTLMLREIKSPEDIYLLQKKDSRFRKFVKEAESVEYTNPNIDLWSKLYSYYQFQGETLVKKNDELNLNLFGCERNKIFQRNINRVLKYLPQDVPVVVYTGANHVFDLPGGCLGLTNLFQGTPCPKEIKIPVKQNKLNVKKLREEINRKLELEMEIEKKILQSRGPLELMISKHKELASVIKKQLILDEYFFRSKKYKQNTKRFFVQKAVSATKISSSNITPFEKYLRSSVLALQGRNDVVFGEIITDLEKMQKDVNILFDKKQIELLKELVTVIRKYRTEIVQMKINSQSYQIEDRDCIEMLVDINGIEERFIACSA